jgi:hypothetical protein
VFRGSYGTQDETCVISTGDQAFFCMDDLTWTMPEEAEDEESSKDEELRNSQLPLGKSGRLLQSLMGMNTARDVVDILGLSLTGE